MVDWTVFLFYTPTVKEIWDQAILYYNLPLTIVLGFIMIYWVLAVLGTIDIEALDIDFDIDLDADVDPDFDLDTDATPGDAGFLVGALKFVNAAEVPLMMVLSFLFLFMCSPPFYRTTTSTPATPDFWPVDF